MAVSQTSEAVKAAINLLAPELDAGFTQTLSVGGGYTGRRNLLVHAFPIQFAFQYSKLTAEEKLRADAIIRTYDKYLEISTVNDEDLYVASIEYTTNIMRIMLAMNSHDLPEIAEHDYGTLLAWLWNVERHDKLVAKSDDELRELLGSGDWTLQSAVEFEQVCRLLRKQEDCDLITEDLACYNELHLELSNL